MSLNILYRVFRYIFKEPFGVSPSGVSKRPLLVGAFHQDNEIAGTASIV